MGFFKTIKHRFGLHRFGQSTQIGVYRWLILSFIAYLLAHWIDQWSLPPVLDWKAASDNRVIGSVSICPLVQIAKSE